MAAPLERITQLNAAHFPPPSLKDFLGAAARGPLSRPARWYWQMTGDVDWDRAGASYKKQTDIWRGMVGGNAARVERRGKRSADELEKHARQERVRQRRLAFARESEEDVAELRQRFELRLQLEVAPRLQGTNATLNFMLRAPHDLGEPLQASDFNEIVRFCGAAYSDCLVETGGVWSEWDAFNLWVAKRLRWLPSHGDLSARTRARLRDIGVDIGSMDVQVRNSVAVSDMLDSRDTDGEYEYIRRPRNRPEATVYEVGPSPARYLELMRRWKASPEHREWHFHDLIEGFFAEGAIAEQVGWPSADPRVRLETVLDEYRTLPAAHACWAGESQPVHNSSFWASRIERSISGLGRSPSELEAAVEQLPVCVRAYLIWRYMDGQHSEGELQNFLWPHYSYNHRNGRRMDFQSDSILERYATWLRLRLSASDAKTRIASDIDHVFRCLHAREWVEDYRRLGRPMRMPHMWVLSREERASDILRKRRRKGSTSGDSEC